ncbi:MAG: transcriptional repressor [Planctomycetota bacterium]|nr:transcriptional repressor [Planctomycetota bacterium]MDP7636546.1 transcriptional repressor [Phycisphaerae bacterium]
MKFKPPDDTVPLLRMTRQRRIILEEFHTPGRHPTPDDVYMRIRRKLPNISLGTVYRNLEILSQAKLIKKLRLGCRQRRYDGGLHRHYHVRCVKCGKISDIPADSFPDLDDTAKGHGFKILGHQLEFEGLCQACRKAGRSQKGR